MKLQEIVELITIRNYVVTSLDNGAINRSVVKELNGILILLDEKIIGILQGKEFKEYIGFEHVGAAIQAVAKLTNIKSGITRK